MAEARFQSFEDRSDRSATGSRLGALRAELKGRGLSGLLVPHADRYQNEYLPASEERLAWLTGFTGSAGLAVVLADQAVLFVDGRYTLQAREQVDAAHFRIEPIAESSPDAWIEQNLGAGTVLGYDPWLHTLDGAERFAKACVTAGGTFVATEPNPIDAIWSDRPAPPVGAVVLHDLRYAGEPTSEKLTRVRTEIEKVKADALVVSDPQSVCWTFNIRGSDVEHTPVALASAIVPKAGRPTIYVDGRKLSNDVRHQLEQLADVHEPDAFVSDLSSFGKAHQSTLR